MAYSQVSISNIALNRIGARGQITSINDNSPNAVKVLSVWDAIFQEVMSERDWKFAKTRQLLQLSPVTPLYGWLFAWALPSDFLRFVRPQRRPHSNNNLYAWLWGGDGCCGWYFRSDPPFFPNVPFKVETLTAGWLLPANANTPALQEAITAYAAANPTYVAGNPIPYPPPFPSGKYCLTNYGGCASSNSTPGTLPAAITYIQLITDYSQLTPGFVNCLAWRLAKELSIGITEDKTKFQQCGEEYKESLNSAEAQNESSDYMQDEDGNYDWATAGRNADVW